MHELQGKGTRKDTWSCQLPSPIWY